MANSHSNNLADQANLQKAVKPIMSANYCQRVRQADYDLYCSRPGEVGYQQAKDLVAEVFKKVYDARCSHFLPLLLSFKSDDHLHGALGMRPASLGSLYLEQYLDKPVEQDISHCFKTPVVRDQVVEIGNLVVRSAGAGQFLLAILGTIVKQAGMRWVVFTATPQVEVMLKKIRWHTEEICRADSRLLSDSESQWGRYYETNPCVRVGNIDHAEEFLTDPYVRGLLSPYSAFINRAAQALKNAGHQ